jgi:hypothetical protein
MTNTETVKQIYINKYFTKRDYDCTNVVYAITDDINKMDRPELYKLVTEITHQNITQLWTQNDVQYMGYL